MNKSILQNNKVATRTYQMGGGVSTAKADGNLKNDNSKKKSRMVKRDSMFVQKKHLKDVHDHDETNDHVYEHTSSEKVLAAPPAHNSSPLSPGPDHGPYSPGATRRGSLGSSWEPNQDVAHDRLAQAASVAGPGARSGVEEVSAAPIVAASETTPTEVDTGTKGT